VFGSCPRQTVKDLDAGAAVGSGVGVSEGVGVGSGCEEKSPQAVMATDKIKTKNIKITSLFERFMGPSFFEESNNQLYKQAALVDGLLV
jgi:hypothetical protein